MEGLKDYTNNSGTFQKLNQQCITLSHVSKDGHEHYPGELNVSVSYSLTNYNQLVIDYEASTNKPTIINLTQHSYFNLTGHNSGDILNHLIRIHANKFIPVNQQQIPTGEITNVANTPFDLQDFKNIREVITQPHQQLKTHKWAGS